MLKINFTPMETILGKEYLSTNYLLNGNGNHLSLAFSSPLCGK